MNGTQKHANSKNVSTSNGDPTLSPSKTLKLTLKVTKSPVNSAGATKKVDAAHGEDAESGQYVNNDQSVLVKSPPTSTSAAIQTPSHHRKPSIFGTATMEEDEEQDEADPEDGELSDVGDDPAEKDEPEQEADEGEGPPVNEEKADDSEVEDVDEASKYACLCRSSISDKSFHSFYSLTTDEGCRKTQHDLRKTFQPDNKFLGHSCTCALGACPLHTLVGTFAAYIRSTCGPIEDRNQIRGVT